MTVRRGDTITLSDLNIHLANGVGPSAFGLTPPPPCPLSLTVDIQLRDGIVSSDEDTMLGLGVNYSAVSKAVYSALSNPTRRFTDAVEVMRTAAAVPLALDAVDSVSVKAELPRALLHAQAAVYEATFTTLEDMGQVSMTVRRLQVACVIGLHPHERAARQRLEVDLCVKGWQEGPGMDHKAVADAALSYLENSSFGTIESLAHSLAQHILSTLPSPTEVRLQLVIRKPSALPFATPSIAIQRSPSDYPERNPSTGGTATPPSSIDKEAGPSSTSSRRAFIAQGSNIGDRISHISRATSLLQSYGCVLVRTGRIYESEPMYVADQDGFVNTAVEVQTDLEPLELLRVLKKVEREVGRVKTFTNGPRVVDLDLVYFGGAVLKVEKRGDREDEDGVGWLEVPHWGVGEREFVLRPLVDIAPDFIDPRLRIPLRTMLRRLPVTNPPQLSPLIPFPRPSAPLRLHHRTPRVMAIINATPDSFSDGAESNLSIPHVLKTIRQMFAAPFPPDILDIGGMSTRPHSEPVSEREELQRVIPLIRAIRADPDPVIRALPISVDTCRPVVARAAVEAGASCINDVRGGREEGMLATMAELDVPVVLMHSRGDSSSMTTASMQDYSADGGVVQGVRREMGDMVDRAEKAGVKRWNIILDPGLGFAKKSSDNLVLLRHLNSINGRGSRLEGYPILVGGSRKGFVGKIVARHVAAERTLGDAAVAAWCVSQAVDVIRVHDSRAAGEVMAMTAAIRDAE